MSMQIKTILLYSSNPDFATKPRELHFKLGEVNIITGRKDTGKSAIIDIVEYCLGRSKFEIPGDKIRDNVAWYAVIYQINDQQVLVAKSAPPQDRGRNDDVYFTVGKNIPTPHYSELKVNSTDEEVIHQLSELLRNSTHDNDREMRETLKTTIEYSTYYLFQKQNVIANEDLLFHRQQDEAKNIIETIPYFLGIKEENDLETEQELQKAQNDLQRARYRLREEERILRDSLARELVLVDEAKQVGLLPTDFVTQTRDDTAKALKQALQRWQPTITSPVKDDRLSQLNDDLLELKQKFSLKLEEIDIAEAFNRDADEYSDEAGQHVMRLDAIDLFGFQDSFFDICPLCSADLSQPIPKISAMRSSLESLRASIQSVERRKPKIDSHIQISRSELEEIRGQISQKKTDIEKVLDELNQRENIIQQIRDSNSQIDRVVGKIEFYLDTIRTVEKSSALRQRVEGAEKRVKQLKSQLDEKQVLNIRESILDSITDQMTKWAQELELQYEDHRYRLDINNLTVVASNLRKLVPMNIMGGGDYLGCHLITLFSLHKHFIEQSKPTPNFLILDQPAQGYFPQSVYKEMEGTPETTKNAMDTEDTDTAAVSRMFNFLFDVCEKLSPDFQIIILEHANLDDERFPPDLVKKFQEALLVEGPWTNRRALIPEEWFNKPGPAQMALLYKE